MSSCRSLTENCIESFHLGFNVALITRVRFISDPKLTSQYGSLFPVVHHPHRKSTRGIILQVYTLYSAYYAYEIERKNKEKRTKSVKRHN